MEYLKHLLAQEHKDEPCRRVLLKATLHSQSPVISSTAKAFLTERIHQLAIGKALQCPFYHDPECLVSNLLDTFVKARGKHVCGTFCHLKKV